MAQNQVQNQLERLMPLSKKEKQQKRKILAFLDKLYGEKFTLTRKPNTKHAFDRFALRLRNGEKLPIDIFEVFPSESGTAEKESVRTLDEFQTGLLAIEKLATQNHQVLIPDDSAPIGHISQDEVITKSGDESDSSANTLAVNPYADDEDYDDLGESEMADRQNRYEADPEFLYPNFSHPDDELEPIDPRLLEPVTEIID